MSLASRTITNTGAWKQGGTEQAYPCGHPRTPENAQSTGANKGFRCRECYRQILRRVQVRRVAAPRLTVEQLRQRFRHENGVLIYLPRTGPASSKVYTADRWNRNFAGKPVRTLELRGGYRCIRVDNKSYLLHRVFWALEHGEWPNGPLDHINGDPRDNRLANLRLCTIRENSFNKRKSRGASRFKGVSHAGQKWAATIRVDGKPLKLGGFCSEHVAAFAYDAAARIHHGEFAALNFPRDGEQSAHRSPLNHNGRSE